MQDLQAGSSNRLISVDCGGFFSGGGYEPAIDTNNNLMVHDFHSRCMLFYVSYRFVNDYCLSFLISVAAKGSINIQKNIK